MPGLNLIDHSPNQAQPSEPLSTASNLILIDNYDSFTWNVYQYLVLEGASVTVYRNDEISLQDLIAKSPTQLVVSPGPGHPDTDSGISKDAIKHFAGKIPVLGVCMGEQCMFSVFGGNVDVTGEILHGKTSNLLHDNKGVYAGLPQDVPVTRYHSLAGTHSTLPECLQLSSWTKMGGDQSKTIIMGVRHKEFVVEGVQFHPESILTAEGRPMLRNFLKMQGGTWKENERRQKAGKTETNGARSTTNGATRTSNGGKTPSILDKIYAHRKADVTAQKLIPSQRPQDLQAAYDLNLSPPLADFPSRLRQSPYPLSLMAEIKRASPSKGIISLSTCAPSQARKYALAGASVISVLTEPEWFKGNIDDLRLVRRSLEGMPNRPAVLRKEFVFEEYQILEARLAGADTVLLIVKMLDTPLLTRLYNYSRSLGMEPLVEVNNVPEMEIATKLGAKVIGVNNRNLATFDVDLETTSNLMARVPKDTIVCALSGISGPKDVEPYLKNGVGAVLVGEALMRAQDTTKFIAELLAGDASQAKVATKERERLFVKICGTRSAEAAKVAIEAGADAIGMILVTGRRRCVSEQTALAISKTVHSTPKSSSTSVSSSSSTSDTKIASNAFEHNLATLRNPHRALLVGVFQNQPLSYLIEQIHLLNLDVVQLHGSEPLEWANLIPVPIIKAVKPQDHGLGVRGYHALPLLDSGVGGTGERLDLSDVKTVLKKDEGVRALLAGGLEPKNVKEVVEALEEFGGQVVGVDVSSGVEDEKGDQDLERIREFILAAKAL